MQHHSGTCFLVKETSIPPDGWNALNRQHLLAMGSSEEMTPGEYAHSPSGEWSNGSGGHATINGSMELTDEMLEGDVQFSEQAREDVVRRVPIDNPEMGFAYLLQLHACYDAVPNHNKLVVFDTRLIVRKAFYGLIYNNARTAFLFDSDSESIVGLLSITDFIHVLLRLRRDRDALAGRAEDDRDRRISEEQLDIAQLSIAEWRQILHDEGRLKDLVSITACESLFRAAELLKAHRIHRLPVVDPVTGNALYILTHKRLLKFLWLFGHELPRPEYLDKPVCELRIGCWDDLKYCYGDTVLLDALMMLVNSGVSGLPIVERGSLRVCGLYSRFDAIGVAASGDFDRLDITVDEALNGRRNMKGAAYQCVVSVRDTDTLWDTVRVLVERSVHRVCVVDDNDALKAVISLSDLVDQLVLQPAARVGSTSFIEEEELPGPEDGDN